MSSRGQLVIGATARGLLMQPGFAGRVLAVVSNAVYLQANPHPDPPPTWSGEGKIVWLAQNHLPMHPRALRGDFDLSWLRVGMTFQSDGACLHFDMGDHTGSPLRFVGARVWQPARIDSARVAPRETVIARARQLPRLGGFPKTLRVCDDARALIGLGDGLTPSGDDCVGGWLFAAWHLRAAYPGAFREEQAAIDALLDYARPRTNSISHALLCDHARGQSVEPLHDLVAALLQGARMNEIETHARRLSAIGATTGQAMLAGALVAMELIA